MHFKGYAGPLWLLDGRRPRPPLLHPRSHHLRLPRLNGLNRLIVVRFLLEPLSIVVPDTAFYPVYARRGTAREIEVVFVALLLSFKPFERLLMASEPCVVLLRQVPDLRVVVPREWRPSGAEAAAGGAGDV